MTTYYIKLLKQSNKNSDAYRQHSEDDPGLLFLAGVQVRQNLMNEFFRFYNRESHGEESHRGKEKPKTTTENYLTFRGNPYPYFEF